MDILITRYLGPGEALGEILFGLIMVLTFTMGARLITGEGVLDARELMIAALGCNLAWGIIDAMFFILGTLFNRSERARFFRRVRDSGSQQAALLAIQQEIALDEEPMAALPQERAKLNDSILTLATHSPPRRVPLSWSDFAAAAWVFILVAATAVPAVIPFLLFENAEITLRACNVLLVLLLFIVGYSWAHYTEARPLHVGLSVMLMGVVLACIAIALGG